MSRCQQEGVVTFQAFFQIFSALDRQTGGYIINPVGDGGFSSNAKYDITEMRRDADNDNDNSKNERSFS